MEEHLDASHPPMSVDNVYDEARRAASYAQLRYPGTYYLAFRDLPDIIRRHVHGRTALDFGCGAGRSTRFLRDLGFEVTGVDIAESMVREARALDPGGDYRLIEDSGLDQLPKHHFDLILSAFAFDNIAGVRKRVQLLTSLRNLLKLTGRLVLLGSTPEIYRHEWASFTTVAFPKNHHARSGDEVSIVMKDVDDSRPVVDYMWTHDDYLAQFRAAGLTSAAEHRPLGRPDDAQPWITETLVAPWVIYVLDPAPGDAHVDRGR
jgi:SAM-dependent methyltransferase